MRAPNWDEFGPLPVDDAAILITDLVHMFHAEGWKDWHAAALGKGQGGVVNALLGGHHDDNGGMLAGMIGQAIATWTSPVNTSSMTTDLR